VAEYCASLSSDPGKTEEHEVTPAVQPIMVSSSPDPEREGDQQLIEALNSPKDRIFVLKLADNIEKLIQDRKCVNLLSSKS
ncbi:MAG TPA: hypothetical protein VGO47_13155, partial [Chlamydiales bacterium]|nr:hypothetical protein [Chlamydiales bacterium]